MTDSHPTYEVSRAGLAKLLERKGKAFVIWELCQNGWDQAITRLDITLTPVPGRPQATLVVEDDDPKGFRNLSHAYTLFAESEKKNDPTRRGRFNLGEKLVIAVCEHAEISTTSGTIVFDGDTRRHHPRRRRDRGSRFEGLIRMTRAELDDAMKAVDALIVPEAVTTTFNGRTLEPRTPLRTFEAVLPTEIADADGYLRLTERKTTVSVYEPRDGETPTLYELGIPVVETGDRWHIDISQKVPLNSDRDNVTPAYLRRVRTLVVNAMHDELDAETASQGWVTAALEDKRIDDDAVRTVVRQRFGVGAVVQDPSDPEGTKISMSQGRTVIPSRAFTGAAWDSVRRAEAALPAGQVTPSPRPYSNDPGAPVRKELTRDEWGPALERVAAYAAALALELMDVEVHVFMVNDRDVPARATWGRRSSRRADLEFNVAHLGRAWFDLGNSQVDELLIHEFGHQYSGDHLSADYHRALCKLGAKLKRLALDDPGFFARSHPPAASGLRMGGPQVAAL